MFKEPVPQFEIPKQEPEAPENFFDGAQLTSSLMERILDMQKQGLTLKGSVDSYDGRTLALLVNDALDELSTGFRQGLYQSQEEIDSLLASKGITSAGGLRKALTSVVINGAEGATTMFKIEEDGTRTIVGPRFHHFLRSNSYYKALGELTGENAL